MQLIQLNEIPDDDSLRQRWNALVERTDRPEVFMTWEWARAAQLAYGESLQPRLIFLQDEDKSLLGLAALATDSPGEFSFLCATTGDYCDFLSAPADRGAIVETVLAECRKSNARITLANLPADSATLPLLPQAASKQGYYLHARSAYQCAQVSLRPAALREQVRASLQRKKMRRLIGAMEEKFSPALEHLAAWEDVKDQLPEFVRAHVARFRAMGRSSNLADPMRQKFLEELARLLTDAGWLRFSRLRVRGKNVAWNYGFLFAGSWFWYQPTFVAELDQYSPGVYLLAKIVAAACDDPNVNLVDLGLGAEGYKERFANAARETLHLTLTRSLPAHLRSLVRYRAAEALKQWPAAEQAVRKLLKRPG